MIDKKIKYKDIKGQKHMLAYITPGEAKTLEKLGGQKTITPEGIPAYPPGMGDPNYDGSGGGTYGGSGGNKSDGRELGAMANQDQSTPSTTTAPSDTRHNPNTADGTSFVSTPDTTTTTTTTPNFSIHDVGTNTVPMYDDFPTVPNVTSNTGLETQRLKNIQLQNELKDYKPKSLFPGFLNIFKLGTPANINFFNKNSIGGKINPKTKEPFGYGIDGFKAYMEQRSLGNVGAYGGTELSQNAINARSGGDDGIMDVYNNLGADTDTGTGTGDADGDGDVDQTDNFIFRYFDKTGETLQAGAGGVEDLMTRIRQRLDNIFTT